MTAFSKSISFRISDQSSDDDKSIKSIKSTKATKRPNPPKKFEVLQPVHKNFYSSGIFGRRNGLKLDPGIMVEFYTNAINQPHKLEHNLAKIERMLIKYENNHQDLVQALCEKYNTEAFFVQLVKSEHEQEAHLESAGRMSDHQHDNNGQWWNRRNDDSHGQ